MKFNVSENFEDALTKFQSMPLSAEEKETLKNCDRGVFTFGVYNIQQYPLLSSAALLVFATPA